MITKVQKATSKGQITLPMNWRKQFDTDTFMLKAKGDTLVIKPATIYEDEEGWTTIFNAKRDNNGKGILAKDMLKMMEKIDKER